MRRGFRVTLLLSGACLAGLVASEAIYRSPFGRKKVERLSRWSRELVASYGVGLHGNNEGLEEVLIAKNLRAVSCDEMIGEEEIDRERDRLRAQFGDEQAFEQALESSELTGKLLREELAEHFRASAWTEKQIAPVNVVTEAEARAFYDAKRDQFVQPQRFRASHIYLAAPEGTPPEVIAAKQSAIQGLAVRLLAGESLAQLAAEASEDEATKSRNGDLGYFSAARMPPEFIAEVEKLRLGEMSSPIRSLLGFHIIQLTDVKPPRKLSYQEARPEIQLLLGNETRAAAVARVRQQLSAVP